MNLNHALHKDRQIAGATPYLKRTIFDKLSQIGLDKQVLCS